MSNHEPPHDCTRSHPAPACARHWSGVSIGGGHPESHGIPEPTTGPDAVTSRGVWVAYNHDNSAFVPFATEIEALRYALGYGMPVKFVAFGDDDWMSR